MCSKRIYNRVIHVCTCLYVCFLLFSNVVQDVRAGVCVSICMCIYVCAHMFMCMKFVYATQYVTV